MSTGAVHRLPLYGWLTAEAISLTGTRVSMIALPWFVLSTTGSATQTGLVAFADMFPLVTLKALAGPLVDRVGARRIAIGADAASAVAVGLVPLLYTLGMLSFPALLALVALAGALRGPGDGAKNAMVPDLVEHAGVPMERATGLASAVERTASMAGAAIAGGLVALIGAADALLLDAASFLVSAAVLTACTRRLRPAAMRAATLAAAAGRAPAEAPGDTAATAPVASPPAGSADDGDISYLRRLREGWDFLRSDPLLLGISLMVAVTNLFDTAYVSVLVPVWAKQSGGGPGSVGLLFAVFSGGAVLGAVVAATWAARLPRYRTYLVAFLICGAPRFFVLAFDLPLGGVLAYGAVAGFGSGFINPVLGAVIFERIPAHLVGRVSSLNSALCWSLMPFGGVVGGLLIGGVGLTPALLVCGAAYLAATMLPALQPRWREMDTRRAVREERAATLAV
ncbi:MFS transporter [Nocardioides mesophilus]|uniref:MFS transporter n=1 Tax=Nocardioides mesophilus TaxID=433659 RepID=A0A7G9R6H1_9ACTN|nr:MFS transporter [Nocardioides mesophilus]QNN51196.1 MFS transporter [Nocardioides mesophilus]